MTRALSRREFLRLAGLAAGAVALASCKAPAEEPVDEPVEDEPADVPAPAEDVTLEFWTFNDFAVGKALELFETFIGEFESDNPGVKVNITGKPGGDILTGLITGAGLVTCPTAFRSSWAAVAI